MLAFVPFFWTIGVPFVPGTRADDPRPSLSGPTEDVDVGRFRIHFTREARDAPSPIDKDGNGLPDLVDTIGLALVAAEDDYRAEGWRPLVDDEGAEGSNQLDVYVRDLDAYGRSTPWRVSDRSWSCFLEIDAGVQLSGSVATSVATHELHHCVEFRYNATLEPWLYESAATYEQYSHVVDPILDVAVGVLYNTRLGAPERRLGAADGRFEYAGFLWMKFWAEVGGRNEERLPALWEALGDAETGAEGLDTEAVRVFGTDLADTFVTHAAWNTFACSGDDGGHYADDVIPCILDVRSPIVAWDGAPFDVLHDQAPFTSAYYALTGTGGRMAVSCDGAEGLRFAAVAVDPNGRGHEIARGEGGDTVVVGSALGGTVRLIVAGTEGPLEASCREVEPPPEPEAYQGCGCETTTGGGWWMVLGILVARRRSHRRT